MTVTPPALYSFTNLWRAYRDCRRNKGNTGNALAFEIDAEAKLLELQQELVEHRYSPGRSICFVTEGPKPREVFAADFRDRIVHHLLVAQIEPIFEPRFIHDSYACRPGKGVLAASDRLMQFLRRATANGRRPAWAIKLDVASFFPSIDKQTLFDLLCRRVRDPELRWLIEVILFHDPTADYRFKAGPGRVPPPSSARYPIAAQKSLFGNENQRGLPIGNLTSQFWANVYLNELDQFVKRSLRCRFYVRYVDDLILLDADADRLRRWRDDIAHFLSAHLKLALREAAAEPQRVARGIDFVGWKTYWGHRLPRRQTVEKCAVRLHRFERDGLRPMWNGLARRVDVAPPSGPVPRADLEGLRAVLASYCGHLRHGASHTDWADLRSRYSWLEQLFVPSGRGPWRLRLRWRARGIGGAPFGRQYGELIRAAGARTLIFCQVGKFIEFHGPQRQVAADVLRLVRVRIGRGGHAFAVGFPLALRNQYVGRALRAGYTVVDVRESGMSGSRPATRRVAALWLPARECVRR
jgi:RNA-directed DNA polymerase